MARPNTAVEAVRAGRGWRRCGGRAHVWFEKSDPELTVLFVETTYEWVDYMIAKYEGQGWRHFYTY